MDQAITRWINALAGSNVLLDSFMIAATRFVVPLLVLLVALQWWSRRERVHVRHTCVAAGLSFLIGLGLNQIILLYVHCTPEDLCCDGRRYKVLITRTSKKKR